MFLQRMMKSVKVEPVYEIQTMLPSKVIGFRGVRDNIGTTSLLTYIANYYATVQNLTVCVIDLDYQTPNHFLSNDKSFNILKKLSNSRESIVNILNKTSLSGNLSYIGAPLISSIYDFLPLKVDTQYVESYCATICQIIDEVKPKFDLVLVDIPSDLQNIAAFAAVSYCNRVFTLSYFDNICISKLQKDFGLINSSAPIDNMTTLIHVNDLYEISSDYSVIDERFKSIATLYRSKNVAETYAASTLLPLSSAIRSKDYNELMYYKGIQQILAEMERNVND